MGRIYLLSSLIVPVPFERKKVTVRIEEIGISEIRELIKNGFISAVGHKSTANFLSKLLEVPVECERKTVYLEANDIVIALQFKERIQKMELGEEELSEKLKMGDVRFLKMVVAEEA